LILAALSGAVLLAAVLGLDSQRARLAPVVGVEYLACFDISGLPGSGPGSVAMWMGSVTLLMAAAISALIYTVRRHRLDDYHGRYRTWLWAAAVWAGLSLEATAGLHHFIGQTSARWFHWDPARGGAFACLAALAVVWIALGGRLLLEVYECRTAFLSLSAVYALWAASIVGYWELMPLPAGESAPRVIGGMILSGHVLLVMTLLWYAGHVLCEAEGLVDQVGKADEARTKRKASSAGAKQPTSAGTAVSARTGMSPSGSSVTAMQTATAGGDRNEVSASTFTAGKGAQRAMRIASSSKERDTYERDAREEDESLRIGRKLNRTERKKLRKEKDRMRRAA
jgi:hypothetical protein